MAFLRIDSWHAKPGRAQDIIDYAKVMRPLLIKHGAKNARLMQVHQGGSSSGLFYGEAEVEDDEDHARLTKSLMADQTVMEAVQKFHSSDGPASTNSVLLARVDAELGERTESVPGCVELISNFRIPLERRGEYIDRVGELAHRARKYDVRVRVLTGLTGNFTGTVGHAMEFRDAATFGRYADDLWGNEETRNFILGFQELGERTDVSLHREIVV